MVECSIEAHIAQLWNIQPWNIPWLRKLRVCGTSKNTSKKFDIPYLRILHNYGIFYRFFGGIFHICANNASVEYSNNESVEYPILRKMGIYGISNFLLIFFRCFTDAQFAQTWNILWWYIPQMPY